MSERQDMVLRALKGARLMLYAWAGARRKQGLPDNHVELTGTIAEVEAAIAKLESPGAEGRNAVIRSGADYKA